MTIEKRDIQRSNRSLNVQSDGKMEDFTPSAVHLLLSDVHRNQARETYVSDRTATIVRIDLESALSSWALTSRQRQVIALYYIAELTGDQTAQIFGITRQAVEKARKKACEALSAQLNGEKKSVAQVGQVLQIKDGAIKRWLEAADQNLPRWWLLPDQVCAELNAIFPPDDARFAKSVSCASRVGDEYPILARYNRAERRELPRPIIYPTFENYGTKKGGVNLRGTRILPRDASTFRLA